MNGINCVVCGKKLGGDARRRYCSPECAKKGVAQYQKEWWEKKKSGVKPETTAVCVGCGKVFEKKGKQQYCSRSCYEKSIQNKSTLQIRTEKDLARKNAEAKKEPRTLEKMNGEELLSYGKISARKQLERMRLQNRR